MEKSEPGPSNGDIGKASVESMHGAQGIAAALPMFVNDDGATGLHDTPIAASAVDSEHEAAQSEALVRWAEEQDEALALHDPSPGSAIGAAGAYVRAHPVKAVAVAAAVGLLVHRIVIAR